MANHTLARKPEQITDLFEMWNPVNFMRSLSWEAMRIEECREGSEYCVRAELPGIDPKNIDVTCDEGVLTISAHREDHDIDGHQGAYRSEFYYGSISRTLPLPRDVKVQDCQATYRDGVLELRMPCSKQMSSKKIKVESK